MEKLAIGVIRTSHGIKGFMKVRSFSGETEHFNSIDTCEIRNKWETKFMEIETSKSNGNDILIKFVGVDSPEEARKYSNWEIWVDREYAVPLDDDEFYLSDVIGFSIICNDRMIGKAKAFIEGGSSDLLEVEMNEIENESKIIPFCSPFIGKIDFTKRTVEILIDWVLD
ncbi:ribosome maturation factor RimM [Spirochaeta cellobiosiphila]|uniref:ribosome maturation factor RimM n=1 Tax=Spirochaeta cellobiosiphila TaxID=504483 RepID=UPI00048EED9C|nr:ribosome maturation factor RimM [Spirochaeta cellobiosiphila]